MVNKKQVLVLGSSSARRQNFLKALGLTFEIDPANLDESPHKREAPLAYVERIAHEKAQCVAARHPHCYVLCADSTISVGRTVLGKPRDAEEAASMLRLMAGRRHNVLTSVVLHTPEGKVCMRTTKTVVKMRPLLEKDIQKYVSCQENWQGFAGGYALQTAQGGALVSTVQGSVSGVVGLPLVETINLLKGAGFNV